MSIQRMYLRYFVVQPFSSIYNCIVSCIIYHNHNFIIFQSGRLVTASCHSEVLFFFVGKCSSEHAVTKPLLRKGIADFTAISVRPAYFCDFPTMLTKHMHRMHQKIPPKPAMATIPIETLAGLRCDAVAPIG